MTTLKDLIKYTTPLLRKFRIYWFIHLPLLMYLLFNSKFTLTAISAICLTKKKCLNLQGYSNESDVCQRRDSKFIRLALQSIYVRWSYYLTKSIVHLFLRTSHSNCFCLSIVNRNSFTFTINNQSSNNFVVKQAVVFSLFQTYVGHLFNW